MDMKQVRQEVSTAYQIPTKLFFQTNGTNFFFFFWGGGGAEGVFLSILRS